MGQAETKFACVFGLSDISSGISKGPCVGAYFDTFEGKRPKQTLLAVLPHVLEAYNPTTGDRRCKKYFESQLTCSAYSQKTILGNILVCGSKEGELFIITPHNLEVIKVVRVKAPLFITSVAIIGCRSILVGDNEGLVRMIDLQNGRLTKTYEIPPISDLTASEPISEEKEEDKPEDVIPPTGELDEDEDKKANSKILSMKSVRNIHFSCLSEQLIVSYRNGSLHSFDIRTGQWNKTVDVRSLCTEAASSSRLLDTFLLDHPVSPAIVGCFHNTNSVWLCRVQKGEVVSFCFDEELKALNQKITCITSISFDQTRGVLFSGHLDGTIYIRKVLKEGKNLGFALQRCCGARPIDIKDSSLLNGTISCMSFESESDIMITGHCDGLIRLVPSISGIDVRAKKTSPRKKARDEIRAKKVDIKKTPMKATSPMNPTPTSNTSAASSPAAAAILRSQRMMKASKPILVDTNTPSKAISPSSTTSTENKIASENVVTKEVEEKTENKPEKESTKTDTEESKEMEGLEDVDISTE